MMMAFMSDSDVLDRFRRVGALLEGHFRLTSGLHSPGYLQCALVLQHPKEAEACGAAIAESVRALRPEVAPEVRAQTADAAKFIAATVDVVRQDAILGPVRFVDPPVDQCRDRLDLVIEQPCKQRHAVANPPSRPAT